MTGYMYILECSDGSFYTGSTKYLDARLEQHKNGNGANYTKSKLPVKLIYFEEYDRIDYAFYREKQVQGWSRKKKLALIKGELENLPKLARNYTQYGRFDKLNDQKDKLNNQKDKLNDQLNPLPELVEGSKIEGNGEKKGEDDK